MAVSSVFSRAIVLLILTRVTIAGSLCRFMSPGCSAPFPPGFNERGPSYWAIGNPNLTTALQSLTTYLNIPQAPAKSPGIMAINPALENTVIGDINDNRIPADTVYQTMIVSFPETTCNETADEWCVFPSVFDDSSQYDGPATPAGGGSALEINYSYKPGNNGAGTMQQTATVNGQTLSMTNDTTEPLREWWPRTECHCESQGVIPAHTYTNTQIVLTTAMPDFDQTLTNASSTFTQPYTSDGGLTWHIDSITIGETTCNNSQNCTTTDWKDVY